MITDKESMLKVIEFYLKHIFQINREIEYRKQIKSTTSAIIINKLYKPIPFLELDNISSAINHSIQKLNNEKMEYINLRYKNHCTYEVICGLLGKKRSTVFSFGSEILNSILFDILINDNARTSIMNADKKCYFFDEKE